MEWAAVINTLIATLPAILVALGTLLVALRSKNKVEISPELQALIDIKVEQELKAAEIQRQLDEVKKVKEVEGSKI